MTTQDAPLDPVAVRVLGIDHYAYTMHVWDSPAKRGTRCGPCDALNALAAALAPSLDTPAPDFRSVALDAYNVMDAATRWASGTAVGVKTVAEADAHMAGYDALLDGQVRLGQALGILTGGTPVPLSPRDPAVQRLVEAARAVLAFKGNAPGMDTCSEHSGCAVPDLREALRQLEQEAGG